MKRGELCESCGHFTEGSHNVIKCPICSKDLCSFCGDLQVCPACFDHYNIDDGIIVINNVTYVFHIHDGEDIGEWVVCT